MDRIESLAWQRTRKTGRKGTLHLEKRKKEEKKSKKGKKERVSNPSCMRIAPEPRGREPTGPVGMRPRDIWRQLIKRWLHAREKYDTEPFLFIAKRPEVLILELSSCRPNDAFETTRCGLVKIHFGAHFSRNEEFSIKRSKRFRGHRTSSMPFVNIQYVDVILYAQIVSVTRRTTSNRTTFAHKSHAPFPHPRLPCAYDKFNSQHTHADASVGGR